MFSYIRRILFAFSLILVCFLGLRFFRAPESSSQGRQVQTIYGAFNITEPLLLDLLDCKAIHRLKHVHQYGVDNYVVAPDGYMRYDHSVGVMVLLRRFGASALEQASGLCHDATHTIFSHVGDLIYKELSPHASYQDEFFDEIMTHHGVDRVLAPHNLTVSNINPHQGSFLMLERDLPDLCCDRLEYNLHGGYLEGLITLADIERILHALRYDQGVWYFVSIPEARAFARIPLQLMLTLWSHPYEMLVDDSAARLVRCAMKKGLISTEEVHAAYDDVMWQRLMDSTDPEIVALRYELLNYRKLYRLSNQQDYTYYYKAKFRGINPFVMIDGTLVRLTDCDDQFAREFEAAKAVMAQGWYIKRF